MSKHDKSKTLLHFFGISICFGYLYTVRVTISNFTKSATYPLFTQIIWLELKYITMDYNAKMKLNSALP